MRKIREVLRLAWERHLSERAISRSCHLSRPTVSKYLERATEAKLMWPLPEGMDDGDLDRLLSRAGGELPSEAEERPMPDWEVIQKELKSHKGVTLKLLWEEFKENNPEGHQLTQFYAYYKRWRSKLDLVLRQDYKAGERMFSDYAGPTVPVIVNTRTGEVREAQVFVCVLGASSYTYSEATWDQQLPSWIMSHVRTFEFFDGCAELLTCDNLRSAISRACRYEPDINPTFQDLATHYGFAVIPSRVKRPRDNAKAEAAVQLVERWILARLRKRVFFSLEELNQAIRELLQKLNDHPFRKKDGCRRSLYEELDRPALLRLPKDRFVFCEWKKAKVNIDYHVELKHHYYSVPYRYVRERVRIRFTADTVEVFRNGKRIASHIRDDRRGGFTTKREHMPASHQRYLEWSPSRIVDWGKKIGPATAEVFERILKARPHPEQGFRSCLGVMRLAKRYSEPRLEAACRRALVIHGCNYPSIRSILKEGLDGQPIVQPRKPAPPIHHENIRGSGYYTTQETQEVSHAAYTHVR